MVVVVITTQDMPGLISQKHEAVSSCIPVNGSLYLWLH